MPFIKITTNAKVGSAAKTAVNQELGRLISIIPGKSEQWLMTAVEDNADMCFSGNEEALCAMIEVKIFGSADSSSLEKFTSALCEMTEKYLGIPQSRVYIAYMPIEHWGWNGGNL